MSEGTFLLKMAVFALKKSSIAVYASNQLLVTLVWCSGTKNRGPAILSNSRLNLKLPGSAGIVNLSARTACPDRLVSGLRAGCGERNLGPSINSSHALSTLPIPLFK